MRICYNYVFIDNDVVGWVGESRICCSGVIVVMFRWWISDEGDNDDNIGSLNAIYSLSEDTKCSSKDNILHCVVGFKHDTPCIMR